MKLSEHQLSALETNEARVQQLFNRFAEGGLEEEEFKTFLFAHAIFIVTLIGKENEMKLFKEHIENTFDQFNDNTNNWFLLSPTSSGSLINSFRVDEIRERYENE